MTAMRGYYCLIQFCPDSSRLEAVNVGVLLFCPAANFIRARTAKSNRRAAKLVARADMNSRGLNAAKRAIERRLEVDHPAFQTVEDLQRFVDTRANVVRLTDPRPVKVFNPQQDLDKLFDELVGGTIRSGSREPVVQELDRAFRRLQAAGRARLNWDVTVPIADVSMHVPYAYRNGVWNLVKPHRFSCQPGLAMRDAMRIAVEGDLLKKHAPQQDGAMQLVVVGLFESEPGPSELAQRVRNVFQEYEVQTVSQADIPTFLAHVEQEAHA